MIHSGQVYVSCQPIDGLAGGEHTRIKIMEKPVTTPGLYGFGKVSVATINPEDGRLLRPRLVNLRMLHADSFTKEGVKRKTGYSLQIDVVHLDRAGEPGFWCGDREGESAVLLAEVTCGDCHDAYHRLGGAL